MNNRVERDENVKATHTHGKLLSAIVTSIENPPDYNDPLVNVRILRSPPTPPLLRVSVSVVAGKIHR